MKKLFVTLFALSFITSCGYKRYGDFTVLANGNTENYNSAQKLSSSSEAVVKIKVQDPLEECVDKVVKSVSGGEFLKSAVVYVKKNGRKIKVVGDVYGTPIASSTAK